MSWAKAGSKGAQQCREGSQEKGKSAEQVVKRCEEKWQESVVDNSHLSRALNQHR